MFLIKDFSAIFCGPILIRYLVLFVVFFMINPLKDVAGWGENDRGVSFTFGPEVVAKFLHKHDLDLICRAHQVSG